MSESSPRSSSSPDVEDTQTQAQSTVPRQPDPKAIRPGDAPGSPGCEPRWNHSAKDGIGTAYNTACRLWFTLSHGVVNEIFCPRADMPSTRDMQFLITDGTSFCHEEKRDLAHELEMPERNAPFYRVTNTDPAGRYRLVKHLLADPHHSTFLMHTRLEIMDESLRGKLKVYAIMAPHIRGKGWGNTGGHCNRGERTFLRAEREKSHMVFGCDRGFSRRSAGYVGASDGWTDLFKNKDATTPTYTMDWEYSEVGPGNIALTGEVVLDATYDRPQTALGADGQTDASAVEFVIGIAFGDSAAGATTSLLQSFAIPFDKHRDAYVVQWQRAAAPREEEDAFAAHTGDDGLLWRISRNVLLSQEDKNFQGAMVASLSTPWGETKSDDDEGGYHLAWTRDLVQSGSALIAAQKFSTPLRSLLWLTATQHPNGSFPQNSWLDGTPYWENMQLDEMAAPLLLGWRLRRDDPESFARAGFRTVLGRSLAYLVNTGPSSVQDRWEENSGYCPSTIATIIAGFIAAAEMARARGSEDTAAFAETYADWLNAHIEEWCCTHQGTLVPGITHHYLRITPADPDAPDPHPDPDALVVQIANGGGKHPAREIVAGDFLHLVRLGIRPADDPLIVDSVTVIDAALKREMPGGPCWRRYPYDGYGQKDDGAAFDKGGGTGRAWPLLTGERGHYELAAGRDPLPYVKAMESFANHGGMLTEQLWDGPDLIAPDGEPMTYGKPTGAAMPLGWSHAEYLTLVRSCRDGVGFDRIEPAFQRYVVGGKRDCTHEMWTYRTRTRRVVAGRHLRLLIDRPGLARWSMDGGATTQDAPAESLSYGRLRYCDLPLADLPVGTKIEWTFYWAAADASVSGQWDTTTFYAKIVSPEGSKDPGSEADGKPRKGWPAPPGIGRATAQTDPQGNSQASAEAGASHQS